MEKNDLKNKGFTLIELIVVIAIIAILAGFLVPSIIRYIDNSRKAIDVQTASQIYKATQLAMASSNDDVANGWTVCTRDGYPAVVRATEAGYQTYSTGEGTYSMRPVAWCRGINFTNNNGSYQNSYFKAILDNDASAPEQRMFTNEMLHCFMQDVARDGVYTGSNRTGYVFDGAEGLKFFGFKYKKEIKDYRGVKRKPECWLIYRRDDTGAPEIWIGYKQGNVQPICRIYPNTAEEYQ